MEALPGGCGQRPRELDTLGWLRLLPHLPGRFNVPGGARPWSAAPNPTPPCWCWCWSRPVCPPTDSAVGCSVQGARVKDPFPSPQMMGKPRQLWGQRCFQDLPRDTLFQRMSTERFPAVDSGQGPAWRSEQAGALASDWWWEGETSKEGERPGLPPHPAPVRWREGSDTHGWVREQQRD